jgi:hypothetical protein
VKLTIAVISCFSAFMATVIYFAATEPCTPGPKIGDWFVIAGCQDHHRGAPF